MVAGGWWTLRHWFNLPGSYLPARKMYGLKNWSCQNHRSILLPTTHWATRVTFNLAALKMYVRLKPWFDPWSIVTECKKPHVKRNGCNLNSPKTECLEIDPWWSPTSAADSYGASFVNHPCWHYSLISSIQLNYQMRSRWISSLDNTALLGVDSNLQQQNCDYIFWPLAESCAQCTLTMDDCTVVLWYFCLYL